VTRSGDIVRVPKLEKEVERRSHDWKTNLEGLTVEHFDRFLNLRHAFSWRQKSDSVGLQVFVGLGDQKHIGAGGNFKPGGVAGEGDFLIVQLLFLAFEIGAGSTGRDAVVEVSRLVLIAD